MTAEHAHGIDAGGEGGLACVCPAFERSLKCPLHGDFMEVARQAVGAYLRELEGFFDEDELHDVIDTADGSLESAALRLSDLRVLTTDRTILALDASDPDDWHEITDRAINGLSNYIREIDGKHEMGAGELAERVVRGWLPPSRLIRAYDDYARQSAADTVLAAARAECCGDNPAPDHSARADHSERMAFAGRLAAAVRAS